MTLTFRMSNSVSIASLLEYRSVVSLQ